jgi:hypothetical protein
MRLAAVMLIVVLSVACTDRACASVASYGEPHVIELYSGGKVVATYESTGKVECTEGGICSFMDAKTRKLVRTSGDIVARVK